MPARPLIGSPLRCLSDSRHDPKSIHRERESAVWSVKLGRECCGNAPHATPGSYPPQVGDLRVDVPLGLGLDLEFSPPVPRGPLGVGPPILLGGDASSAVRLAQGVDERLSRGNVGGGGGGEVGGEGGGLGLGEGADEGAGGDGESGEDARGEVVADAEELGQFDLVRDVLSQLETPWRRERSRAAVCLVRASSRTDPGGNSLKASTARESRRTRRRAWSTRFLPSSCMLAVARRRGRRGA